jgi:dihydrofolate synthase/folylpolyglutamate synthase
MYQNVGAKAYKKDLSNSIRLDNYLNNPHKNYKSIHVAGTNGKGSTCHYIAAALESTGFKVGLYTSPHLVDFRERIRINGEMISEEEVLDFINVHNEYLVDLKLSFFEMTVGLAFDTFKRHQVDYAVIETGLGGRLDSTNIITPVISVITNISLDHTDLLGDTVQEIAMEKAGIIKQNIPVVIGEQTEKLRQLFFEYAKRKSSTITLFNTNPSKSYLQNNKNLAQLALTQLANTQNMVINYEILDSLDVPGRYQIVGRYPTIILDVSHNTEGLKKLFESIRKESFDTLHVLFGTTQSRDLNALIRILPRKAYYYLCAAKNVRSENVSKLSSVFEHHARPHRVMDSVSVALKSARAGCHENDCILITGSTFIVGEIYEELVGKI